MQSHLVIMSKFEYPGSDEDKLSWQYQSYPLKNTTDIIPKKIEKKRKKSTMFRIVGMDFKSASNEILRP